MSPNDPSHNAKTMEDRLASLEARLSGIERRLERIDPAPALPSETHRPVPAFFECASSYDEDSAETTPPPIPRVETSTGDPAPKEATDELPSTISEIKSPPSPNFEPEPPRPSRVRNFFEAIHCWPPPSDGPFEASMATWWLTRIGALLAVIAAAFFGVFVSQNTAAWVRWLELAAVAVGATAVGWRLERTQPKYGAVIFGAGLGLIYFAAFAAYALRGVKILDSPVAAAAWQYAAMGTVLTVGLRRRSGPIATGAIVFGYISALFSASEGLDDFALAAAMALAVLAIAFDLMRRSWLAALAALPLAYLICAVVALWRWSLPGSAGPPALPFMLAAPMMLWACFAVGDALAFQLRIKWPGLWRRVWLTANGAAALAIGYAMTRIHYPDGLETYYYAFAAALAVPAAWFWFSRPDSYRMQNYFLKSTAMLTVGLMATFGTRTEWLALAVEGWVLLAAVWRSRRMMVEAAMIAVWAASTLLLMVMIIKGHMFEHQAAAVSMDTLRAGIWLALAAGWCAAQDRLLRSAPAGGEPAPSHADERGAVNAIYGIVLACSTVFVMRAHLPGAAWPLGGAAILLALGVLAWGMRSGIPAMAGGMAYFAMHLMIWRRPAPELATPWFIAVHLAPVAVGWAASAGLAVWASRKRDAWRRGAIGIDAILHLCWIPTLLWTLAQVFPGEAVAWSAVAVSGAMLAVGRRRDALAWADLSVWPLIVAWMGWGEIPNGIDAQFFRLDFSGPAFFWILPMAGAVAWFAALARWRPLARRMKFTRFKKNHLWLHCAVAMLWWWEGLERLSSCFALDWEGFMTVTLALSALAALPLARWMRVRPARNLPLVWFIVAMAHTLFEATGSLRDPVRLAVVLLSASAMVVWPLLARSLTPFERPKSFVIASWYCGLLGMAMAFDILRIQGGLWETYLTAWWAAVAIAIFAAGFAGRLRTLRLIGLLGVALCVPRILIVDVHSAFARIVVFALLGVGLLAMGFLYQRFQGWLTERDQENSIGC